MKNKKLKKMENDTTVKEVQTSSESPKNLEADETSNNGNSVQTVEEVLPQEPEPQHSDLDEINFVLDKLNKALTLSTKDKFSDISFSYADISLFYKLFHIAKDKMQKFDITVRNATIRDETLVRYVTELEVLLKDSDTLSEKFKEYQKEILRLSNIFIKR